MNYFEMSVPKRVTAGWARRDVKCHALFCLFLIFEQRSYCPASKSRTSWPPTPAKTNSGTLTCYNVIKPTGMVTLNTCPISLTLGSFTQSAASGQMGVYGTITSSIVGELKRNTPPSNYSFVKVDSSVLEWFKFFG
jgi:hypothetical protein